MDPLLGSLSDLKALVRDAHSRGIRVVLDAVFNHTSWTHPFFEAFQRDGFTSEYAKWYHPRVDSAVTDEDMMTTSVDGGIGGIDYRPVTSVAAFPLSPSPRPNYECFAFVGSMPKLNLDHPPTREYFLSVARYWIEEADIDGWRVDVANEMSPTFLRAFRDTVKGVKSDAWSQPRLSYRRLSY